MQAANRAGSSRSESSQMIRCATLKGAALQGVAVTARNCATTTPYRGWGVERRKVARKIGWRKR